MADTILNVEMRPVFVGDPYDVRRRLLAPHGESWSKVLIGSSGDVVTIAEYLYEEKYRDVIQMINEVLRKSDLAMYQRNPDRLKTFIETTARKIIERAQRD